MADGVKPGDDPADAPANPADPPAAAGGDAAADEATQSIEANFQLSPTPVRSWRRTVGLTSVHPTAARRAGISTTKGIIKTAT